jgi:hypothetical protein
VAAGASLDSQPKLVDANVKDYFYFGELTYLIPVK